MQVMVSEIRSGSDVEFNFREALFEKAVQSVRAIKATKFYFREPTVVGDVLKVDLDAGGGKAGFGVHINLRSLSIAKVILCCPVADEWYKFTGPQVNDLYSEVVAANPEIHLPKLAEVTVREY